MGELRLSEHEALGGGSFSTTGWLGDFIAALAGRWLPGRGDQTAGYHDLQFVDAFDSMMRLLRHTFAGYVYKDSTDADLEFSVQPFTIEHRGMLCAYAGAVNLGPVAAGATRYIYADLSSAPTVSIAVAGAWPADNVPHIKLEAIAAPATGAWKDQHRTRYARVHAVTPAGGIIYPIQKEFAYNTSSPLTIGTVPVGARVKRIVVAIDTVFDGTIPTLEVGDSGDSGRLMTTTMNDPKTVGPYINEPYYKYAAQTDLLTGKQHGTHARRYNPTEQGRTCRQVCCILFTP